MRFARQGQLDSAILRAPLGGVVRGDGLRLAKTPRRDNVRLHAVRDEILHHRFGTLLTAPRSRGRPAASSAGLDWGVVGIAVHHDFGC